MFFEAVTHCDIAATALFCVGSLAFDIHPQVLERVLFMRDFFFFFQAEDGIRDADVTGVQTCALPIFALLAISPLMDARPRAARPATVGAASAQAGDDPQPGEKRTATPFSEQGHAAEAQAVEPGGTEVVARAAAKKMGGVPARGLTRTAHHVG